MDLKTLDHVALWVADREAIADVLTGQLGMHVIDRTDTFTLVGADARRGKLTLFDAEGPRYGGALKHIALRVPSLDAVLEGVSVPMMKTRFDVHLELPEELEIVLVEAPTDVAVDLDHVAIESPDPAAAAEAWEALGFRRVPAGPAGGERLEVGGAFLDLRLGSPEHTERPHLNHLAVLVDSADEWRQTASDAGFEIADVKDAANTYAVFVTGPGGVVLEYVEHKPSFSLV